MGYSNKNTTGSIPDSLVGKGTDMDPFNLSGNSQNNVQASVP